MSITDELRKWAEEFCEFSYGKFGDKSNLIAIADRIDAVHEKACGEAYSKGMKSIWLPDPTEYIRLPVDADGIPIHEGDVMKHPACVDTAIVCGIGHNTFFVRDNHGEFYRHPASTYVHYHKPTVEDVLREFAGTLASAENNWGSDVDKAIADFAAKLRLADED